MLNQHRVTTRRALDVLLGPINDRYGTYRGLIRLGLAQAELLTRRLRPFTAVTPEAVRRVVFVCRGNIWRSAFAEAQARTLGLNAASFGLATSGGVPVPSTALAAAAPFGIDLSGHRSTGLQDFVLQEGDLLLAMEVRQARVMLALPGRPPGQVSLLGLWATPSCPHIHDPDRLSAAYGRRCLAIVADSVKNLARQLRTSPGGSQAPGRSPHTPPGTTNPSSSTAGLGLSSEEPAPDALSPARA
jgi:protein-tyrosine phosphatase